MRIRQTLIAFLAFTFISFQLLGQDPVPNKKIVVLGSSVASGWVTSYQVKYDMQNGYAYRLARLLDPKGWEVINISIPGFDTKSTIERFNDDVLPLNTGYVLIGLSMSNEGLETQNPDSVSISYESGIKKLIELCRENDIQPVVGLCYSNDNYTEEQYAYLKKMNRKIASWDVPSINFLGVLDDGHGHFPQGYIFDPNHPDDRGHEEMFYGIVPDMFDALEEGKEVVQHGYTSDEMLKLEGDVLSYVPEEVMHSFSVCYDFKTSSSVRLLGIKTSVGDQVLSISDVGLLKYNGIKFEINSGNEHQLVFTHQYLVNKTVIFIDGSPVIEVDEQLEPLCFRIGDESSNLQLSNLLVYRAALNEEEIRFLMDGNWFNASLEVASLINKNDFSFKTQSLTNHALSLGHVILGKEGLEKDIAALEKKVAEAEAARRNELKVEHRKAIAIDPATLDQYVGSYEVEPGDNMLVVKEEGALFLDDHGRKAEILPEGNDQFFIQYPGDILVIFKRDEEGNIKGLVFSMNGREMPAKKL